MEPDYNKAVFEVIVGRHFCLVGTKGSFSQAKKQEAQEAQPVLDEAVSEIKERSGGFDRFLLSE